MGDKTYAQDKNARSDVSYTKEELEFLWTKISTGIVSTPTPYLVTLEEDEFLDYLYRLKKAEPTSWGINEVFNESEKPKFWYILEEPLWKMPLRINDDSLVMRTIAAGRLEIAK